MKPRVLVIYYTQTGQLEQILDHLVQPLQQSCTIDYAIVEPEQAFPFPWNRRAFFDAMPECVLQIPIPIRIKAYEEIKDQQYDLVILGYQPWFLHPSQPTTGLLAGKYASLLEGKKVLTVIGSRNMWLNAQECVKAHLQRLKAQHVGNILFQDRHSNLVSLLTVIRWAFKGQKEAGGLLPDAGVSDKDIKEATKYGAAISEALSTNNYLTLQTHLLAKGAVEMVPGLVVLEQRGIKNFRYWAKFIREKGGPGAPERASRVKLFERLLLTGIFILTPVSSLTAAIKTRMHRAKLNEDVRYFQSVRYEPNKL